MVTYKLLQTIDRMAENDINKTLAAIALAGDTAEVASMAVSNGLVFVLIKVTAGT